MHLNPKSHLPRLLLAGTLLSLSVPASSQAAQQFYGLDASERLVSFQSDSPSSLRSVRPIGRLAAGERIVGLDVRPATDQLYGVGSQGRVYVINRTTGNARAVGGPSPLFPPAATQFGMDFNPLVDRIRLVSELDSNQRINPDTGLFTEDANLAYAPGDSGAGENPQVSAIAYTNPFTGPAPDNAILSTLYGIDSARNTLVTISPANSGLLQTVGSLGVDVGETNSMDITQDEGNGSIAYASMRPAGASGSRLYRIDLTTGKASEAAALPQVGQQGSELRALAAVGEVADDQSPVEYSLSSSSYQTRSRLLSRGLEFTVACNEACTYKVTLRRIGSRITTSSSGVVGETLNGAGISRNSVRLNSSSREAVRRRSTLFSVSIEVKDGAGNSKSAIRFMRSR